MVKIPAFEVEQWMDKYENTPGVLNIAETCAASISLSELVGFHSAGPRAAPPVFDFSKPLTYGAIRGSEGLRRNIAALYENPDRDADDDVAVTPEDIIVTQGAINANYLVLYALVGPGDHVVCVFPTYQQLYTVPETLGAEVSLWELRAEDGYVPDVGALEKLIRSNTKMIIINNPNNPTGIPIPSSVLKAIISLSQKKNLILFSDEVYRPLFHSPSTPSSSPPPPSALSHPYKKVITTSSLSKSWALAGIRLGWIATHDHTLLNKIASARDYTTISVSQLDDAVAQYALSPAVYPNLLARNLALARTNLALLDEFVEANRDVCDWVKPQAGTTAFIRFSHHHHHKTAAAAGGGEPVDDEDFCLRVLRETGVMFLPGSRCFGHGRAGFKGFVRIGYVNPTEVLREALGKLSLFVEENLR